MSEPMFSVVIPAYNSAEFITKTLDCLKTQTFKDFEVVVINDGSNDDTQILISKYIASNPDLDIRLFNQKNRGIAGARNRGILESKGHNIAFLDHDDIWYPEKLNRCYEIFRKYPEIDLVCHNELMRDSDGNIIRYLYHGPATPEMFRRLLLKGSCLSTSATAVKKKVLLDVGLFREYSELSTAEDYDLWLRLSKKYNFYFIKEILGEYLITDKNASLNLEKHYNNQIETLKLNFKEYNKKNILDFFLIKFRILKIYLLMGKDAICKAKIEKAFKYLLKALLQLFSYE